MDTGCSTGTCYPTGSIPTSLCPESRGRISGDSFGRLVVRPDSGDPAETCKACGDPNGNKAITM